MIKFDKNGVNFVGFGSPNSEVGIVMESVEKGHFEEFVHDKSTFIYIFLEGEGVFFGWYSSCCRGRRYVNSKSWHKNLLFWTFKTTFDYESSF